MSRFRVLVALCITTIIGACGAVAPRGMVEASSLDPLNTPPEELGLAVSVPDAIVLSDGDAIVRLALTTDRETLVDTRVPLSVERDQAALPDGALPGDTVYAAFLTPKNASTLAAAQAEIRALRAAGTIGEGTLSIAVIGGCRTGAPLDSLYVSTWLRTSPSAPFVPLTRRMDILDKFDDTGVMLPPCDK